MGEMLGGLHPSPLTVQAQSAPEGLTAIQFNATTFLSIAACESRQQVQAK
jgi:hypothetical protein